MPNDESITEDDKGQLVITTPLVAELRSIRSEVTSGFASVTQALTTKADKADVQRLESRLDSHARDIDSLKAWRHDREVAAGVHQSRDVQGLTKRQKLWGALGAIALILATTLGPMIDHLVH